MAVHKEEDLIQSAIDSDDSKMIERAIRLIDEKLESESGTEAKVGLLLNKATFCGRLGRLEAARQLVRAALETSNGNPLLSLQCDYLEGCLYDQEEEPAQAYQVLTATLTKHMERLHESDVRFIFEDIQQRRAFDLFRMEKYKEAASLLREVLLFEIKPRDRAVALVNLGISHSHLRDHQSALNYLLEALQSDLPHEWVGHVHFYLGLSYAHLKCLRDSKASFLLSARAMPTPQVYAWLSKICGLLGEKNEEQHYALMARPS